MVPIATVIGDSHVGGLEAPLRQALTDKGWGLAGAVSRVGWTTGRFERDGDVAGTVRAFGPVQLVLIVLGTNDWGVRSADAYRRSVAAVATAAAAGGAKVVWVGPPAVTRPDSAPGVARAASLQREVLGEAWLDSAPLTWGAPFRDGIHLTGSGYKAWAEGIVRKLVQTPPRPPPSPPAGSLWRPAGIAVVVALGVGALGYVLGRLGGARRVEGAEQVAALGAVAGVLSQVRSKPYRGRKAEHRRRRRG